jgi:hypothetical protein
MDRYINVELPNINQVLRSTQVYIVGLDAFGEQKHLKSLKLDSLLVCYFYDAYNIIDLTTRDYHKYRVFLRSVDIKPFILPREKEYVYRLLFKISKLDICNYLRITTATYERLQEHLDMRNILIRYVKDIVGDDVKFHVEHDWSVMLHE